MHIGCQGVKVAVLGWVVVAGAAAWSVLAVAVAVVIGRVVRLRDRQVPVPPRRPGTAFPPAGGVPAPRAAPDAAADRDLERG